MLGMGALISENGCGFRVWAPNVEKVHVYGNFNNWDENSATLLSREGDGYWYGFVSNAKANDTYKYILKKGDEILYRNDPYAHELQWGSGGNSLILETRFDWQNKDFIMPSWNELIIYEFHHSYLE